MADDKVTQLSTAGTVQDTDLVPLVQNVSTVPVTNKLAWSALKTAIKAALNKLESDRTYYVRTDGSDSNNGLTNTAGGAFLTIQKGIDIAASLDRSTYTVTVQVGNGTYAENLLCRNGVGANPIIVQGDTTTPGNVIIQPTSGIGIYSLGIKTAYTFQGFRLVANPSGFAAMVAEDSYLRFSNIEFSSGWSAHIYTVYNGFAEATGNYSIIASVANHAYAEYHGVIKILNRTITLTGTPAFSNAFARAVSAHVTLSGNTYSGSATGSRYNATLNGVIYTNGATLPGNAAGSTATGGQYA